MFDNLVEQIKSLNRKAEQPIRKVSISKEFNSPNKRANWENMLSVESSRLCRSLNNLALLYHAMGRLTDAEPLYLQAMEIRKVQLGENHPDYATSLNNLGRLYYAMGRFTDAEPLYLQAMEIIKVQLGENHPDYATSLNNLAGLYHAMGRLTDAEPLYLQAMEIERCSWVRIIPTMPPV